MEPEAEAHTSSTRQHRSHHEESTLKSAVKKAARKVVGRKPKKQDPVAPAKESLISPPLREVTSTLE